jgi:hypothetical protein
MFEIRLRNGRIFNFAKPETTPLCVDDIAWGLSHEYRYSNQSHHLITVAQHSVCASQETTIPQEYRMGILFHDASEAVMRDLSSPLKKMLPDYRELETKVQAAILNGLGIEPAPEELIKEVDEKRVTWEMGWIFNPDVKPGVNQVELWSPSRARSEFLSRYWKLQAYNL